jgi:hypothetical protein
LAYIIGKVGSIYYMQDVVKKARVSGMVTVWNFLKTGSLAAHFPAAVISL